MLRHLTRKLEQRDRLSEEEKRVLEGAIARTREVGADEDMVRQGDRPSESLLLLDGFAGRYRIMENGKRQITAIHVVGDFVDLHSFLIKTMDHAVVALSRCKVASVPHASLTQITVSHPHLARMLWLSTVLDGAIQREWLVAMGRRSALGQTAHLLCEMFLRLQAVGETENGSVQFPLTQAAVGDVLGLSSVHVNRMVQELRRAGLITWHGHTLIITDWERLTQVAEFDATYLNLKAEPR